MPADTGCLSLVDAHNDFQFMHVSTKAFTTPFSEVQKKVLIFCLYFQAII